MSRTRFTVNEQYRPLVKLARKQGWTLTHTGSQHLQLTAPWGTVVTFSGSPNGGNRGYDNFRSRLRRAGLKF